MIYIYLYIYLFTCTDKLRSTKQTLLEFKKHCAEKREAPYKEKMDLLRDIKNLIQETLQNE